MQSPVLHPRSAAAVAPSPNTSPRSTYASQGTTVGSDGTINSDAIYVPAVAGVVYRRVEHAFVLIAVLLLGLVVAGQGSLGHLAAALTVGASVVLSRSLRVRWHRGEAGAAVTCVTWLVAACAMAVQNGHAVGAHLMLLPLCAIVQASFDRLRHRLAASSVVGGAFLVLEVAKIEPDHEVANADVLRISNRVALLALMTFFVHVLRREGGELRGQIARTRASRQKMKESAQARMSFLTMMSHEIRTPLNAVIAFSDMLCAALKDDEEHANMAQTVASASQALLAIINDVLDFSRVDSGQLTLEPAPVELDSVVDDTLSALHAMASAKGLALCADVQLPLPCTVEVDAVRLRQVLTNVVGNALKFTERGHVLLTVSRLPRGETIEFAVSDTGRGIPRESLATIFEPYRQADDRLVRSHDGTGLGLAICSRIAKAMGGTLTVQSELGRGSTFRLRAPLPVQQPVVPMAATEQPASGVTVDVQVTGSAVLQSTLRSAVAAMGGGGADSGDAPDVVVTNDPTRQGPNVVLVADPLHAAASSPNIAQRLLLPVRRTDLRRALLAAGTPPPAGARALPAPAAPPAPSMLRLDVLVAEDNAVNRKVISHMLKRLGCLARMAVNGRECVEQFKERRPDVVLMDCHMPVMDGFEATRAIRAIDKGVPIFALTADALEAANTEALASGMNRVLTKPIVLGTLREALVPLMGP